jgi:preprotein translocase subunit SecE
VKEVSEVKKTAENTEKAVKKSGESKLSKILNWFKNLPKRISKPFKNMYYELKKVTWPSKEKLIAYSVIVLVFMLFMGIVIGLLDMGASALVRMLIA